MSGVPTSSATPVRLLDGDSFRHFLIVRVGEEGAQLSRDVPPRAFKVIATLFRMAAGGRKVKVGQEVIRSALNPEASDDVAQGALRGAVSEAKRILDPMGVGELALDHRGGCVLKGRLSLRAPVLESLQLRTS